MENIKETVLNYPFFIKKPDGLYLTDKNIGERKIIYLTLGGSHAYGTNVEGSDLDVRGIALRTKEEILLCKDFEQFVDTETDTVIYSFDKMLTLLTACNPNTIEILGTRYKDVIYIDPIGETLIINQKIFLSRKAVYSFAGYANAQLHRLSNRSIRGVSQEERERHILKSIQNAEATLKERYQETGDSINLYIDRAVNPDMETEIFMDVHLTHYPLRDYKDHWSEMNSIVKSYKRIGKRNNSAYNRGKITKHCMHLIRLYFMLFDILEYGEINTYRKEREFLLQIRDGLFFDGEIPKPELYEYVGKLEKRLEYLKEYTPLPDSPDYQAINKLLYDVNNSICCQ